MSESPGDTFDPTQIVSRPYLFERKDRKAKPYGVRFKLKNGKYLRRFFTDEFQRADFIREHRVGAEVSSFNAAEWQRWLYLKSLCARYDTTPEAVIGQWEATGAGKIIKAPDLAKLVSQYIATKDNRSKDYRKHLESVLVRQMVPHFGADCNIAAITRDELQTWLDRGEKHPTTYRNHRAYVRGLMHWAHDQGYITDVLKTRAPEILPKTPAALTVKQVAHLFEANKEYPEACAMLAIGAFAGLRSANIARLKSDEVRLRERQIFIPADKFKTGRSHLIEGAPANLWKWLNAEKVKAVCAWSSRQQRHILDGCYVRAGITPPKNALRHSFATYKCALDGSAEKASYILGHTNPAEIWQSYKGIATKADAKRYFAIVPKSKS